MWMRACAMVLALTTPAFADRTGTSGLVDPAHVAAVAPAPVDRASLEFRPGSGLSVTSEDGRFSLALRARMQIQYAYSHAADADGDEQSLMVRRMRLVLAGRAYSPHVRYYLQFGFANRDMLPEGDSRRTPIRDVRIDLDHWRDLNLRIGETKVPFSRERLTSSGELQLVDRSLANEEFNLDRDIGVQALSKNLGGWDRIGYAAGVFLGEGRGAYQPTGIDFLYAARLEVFPFGPFEHEGMADFVRTSPRVALGVGYGYLQAGKRSRGPLGDVPADGGTTTSHNVTVDLVTKAYGFSSLVAFHLRDGRRESGGLLDEMGAPVPLEAARNGWGLLVQAGYLIPRSPFEVSGRYTALRGRGETTLEDRDEAAGGFGWYVAEHNLKLQVDLARTWGDAGSEVRARTQLQLAL